MKFGIICCGSIGVRHISNLINLKHTVIAYNRGLGRRKYVEKKFNILTYSNIKLMLKNHNFDAVFICSPNSQHLKHALIVAEKKINLFIEKPLCLYSQDLSKLKKIAQIHKIQHHVSCNLRFDFGVIKLIDFLNKKKLGEVYNVEVETGKFLPDWHPQENYKKMYSSKKNLGGGVLYDMIHEIDLITHLFGFPKKITSSIMKSGILDIETSDFAKIIFKHKKKLITTLSLNYLDRPHRRIIKVSGTKGFIEINIINKIVRYFNYNSKKQFNYIYPKNYSYNEMHLKQLVYFINFLKNNKKSINNFDFAFKNVILLKEIENNNFLKKNL